MSWMCKKQTSVSHSSTESEIISFDAGLRMDGLPALDLWDVVTEALLSFKSTQSPTHHAAGNFSRNHKSKPKQKGNRDVGSIVACGLRHHKRKTFGTSAPCFSFRRQRSSDQDVFERQKPNDETRSRSHRFAFDWLFDRINVDPKIQIKYVDTENPNSQDVLTKGNFTRDEWNHFVEPMFFLQSFLSIRKAECHVQYSSRKHV